MRAYVKLLEMPSGLRVGLGLPSVPLRQVCKLRQRIDNQNNKLLNAGQAELLIHLRHLAVATTHYTDP